MSETIKGFLEYLDLLKVISSPRLVHESKSGQIKKEGARIPPSIAGLNNGNHEQSVRGRTCHMYGLCTHDGQKICLLFVDKIIMLTKNN